MNRLREMIEKDVASLEAQNLCVPQLMHVRQSNMLTSIKIFSNLLRASSEKNSFKGVLAI
jgi:hypothetical protein